MINNAVKQHFVEVFGKLPTAEEYFSLMQLITMDDGFTVNSYQVMGLDQIVRTRYSITSNDYMFREPYEPEPWETNHAEYSEEPMSSAWFDTIQECILHIILLIDEEYGRDNEIYSVYYLVKALLGV